MTIGETIKKETTFTTCEKVTPAHLGGAPKIDQPLHLLKELRRCQVLPPQAAVARDTAIKFINFGGNPVTLRCFFASLVQRAGTLPFWPVWVNCFSFFGSPGRPHFFGRCPKTETPISGVGKAGTWRKTPPHAESWTTCALLDLRIQSGRFSTLLVIVIFCIYVYTYIYIYILGGLRTTIWTVSLEDVAFFNPGLVHVGPCGEHPTTGRVPCVGHGSWVSSANGRFVLFLWVLFGGWIEGRPRGRPRICGDPVF